MKKKVFKGIAYVFVLIVVASLYILLATNCYTLCNIIFSGIGLITVNFTIIGIVDKLFGDKKSRKKVDKKYCFLVVTFLTKDGNTGIANYYMWLEKTRTGIAEAEKKILEQGNFKKALIKNIVEVEYE